MLKLFGSDPQQKLEKELSKKLRAARDAQRGGNIPLYAELSAEAEKIGKSLDELRQGA